MACPRDHDASGMPVHWGHTQIVTLFWCGEYEGSLLKWKVGDQNCRNPANKANIIFITLNIALMIIMNAIF